MKQLVRASSSISVEIALAVFVVALASRGGVVVVSAQQQYSPFIVALRMPEPPRPPPAPPMASAFASPFQQFPQFQYPNSTERAERFINHDYVPPISAELLAHTDVYRPPTFSILAVKPTPNVVIVEFNYTRFDSYNRYSMHVRYHGHENLEMTTKRSELDKQAPNRIVLRRFLEAQYVICIALYAPPSARLPPLSTSDMCVDVFIGEEKPRIGKHHNKTGLLMPALLVLVCVHLIAIAFIYEARKAQIHKRLRCLQTSKKEAEKVAKEKSTRTLDYFLNKQENDELKFTKVLLYYDDDEDFYYEPPVDFAHAFTPYNSSNSDSSSNSGRNSSLGGHSHSNHADLMHQRALFAPPPPATTTTAQAAAEKRQQYSSSGDSVGSQLPRLRLQDLNLARNTSSVSFIQLQNETNIYEPRHRPKAGPTARYQTQTDDALPPFY